MRSATFVKRPITVSGRLLETPRLKSDAVVLKSNEDVFKEFVKKLSKIGQRVYRDDTKNFWTGISKDEVEQLLRDFKTHQWHLNFQGPALADFIRSSADVVEWDVVIAEGSESEYSGLILDNETLRIKPEKRAVKATNDQISISGTKVRVGAGGAAKIGLSKEQRKKAEDKFMQENPDKKHIPDKAYLDIERPPILMLHVIAVDKTGTDDKGNPRSQIDEGVQVPDYLFALGVGIPAIGEEKTANYMVNLVEMRNYFDSEEDEDE